MQNETIKIVLQNNQFINTNHDQKNQKCDQLKFQLN